MIATLLFALALAAPSAALEVRVKDVHAPSTNVGASIELRDVLPDRFKKLLDDGRVLHLRVQTELWESRPVWDRLVYPAMIRVLRFARAASGREITITDSAGEATTYAAVPNPLAIAVDIGKRDRLVKAERYYVHVIATVGTIADRDIDDVNDALFGRPTESNGLGSLGRMVFRKMIEISDYLQSVTAETKSKPTELLRP
ncbi:MAG TPA: hypothetical protein VGJ29_09250 [Vicinamibacterales bacterium]